MAGVLGLARRKPRAAAFAVDVAIACAAVLFAFLVRHDLSLGALSGGSLVAALAAAGVAAAAAFHLTGTNVALWRYVAPRDFGTLLAGATAAVLGFLALMFLWDRLATVPRAVPVIQWLALVVGLCGSRLVYAALSGAPRAGASTAPPVAWMPVLLVGGGEGTAAVVRLLHVVPEVGWTPIGILDERLTVGRALDNVPVLGRPGDFRRVVAGLALRGTPPCRLVLAGSGEGLGPGAAERLRAEAGEAGIGFTSVPELLRAEGGPARSVAAEGGGERRLDVALARMERRVFLAGKRVFDVAASAAVLALAAPAMAAIGAAVRCSIGSPVLFHQVRGGRDGRPFVMVKFRTMAEAYGADGCLAGNATDRTTWVGRALRRTRLDELPQFWNVLVGNMSVVGPRPLVAMELAELPDGGAARSSVRPGITGWAQVHGGQLLDLPRKAALDVWYARHASFALDARILLLTVRTVVRGERLDDAVPGRAERAAAHAEAGAG